MSRSSTYFQNQAMVRRPAGVSSAPAGVYTVRARHCDTRTSGSPATARCKLLEHTAACITESATSSPCGRSGGVKRRRLAGGVIFSASSTASPSRRKRRRRPQRATAEVAKDEGGIPGAFRGNGSPSATGMSSSYSSFLPSPSSTSAMSEANPNDGNVPIGGEASPPQPLVEVDTRRRTSRACAFRAPEVSLSARSCSRRRFVPRTSSSKLGSGTFGTSCRPCHNALASLTTSSTRVESARSATPWHSRVALNSLCRHNSRNLPFQYSYSSGLAHCSHSREKPTRCNSSTAHARHGKDGLASGATPPAAAATTESRAAGNAGCASMCANGPASCTPRGNPSRRARPRTRPAACKCRKSPPGRNRACSTPSNTTRSTRPCAGSNNSSASFDNQSRRMPPVSTPASCMPVGNPVDEGPGLC
mmetsp:Transcript_122298/g.351339  ORF Transcript_122298/g.351339 Transcript_122298/m.351339 type:complete len:419 (-) Transcript_122298:1014-2270(-)